MKENFDCERRQTVKRLSVRNTSAGNVGPPIMEKDDLLQCSQGLFMPLQYATVKVPSRKALSAVTQNHFYSINATQDHTIPCNTTQFPEHHSKPRNYIHHAIKSNTIKHHTVPKYHKISPPFKDFCETHFVKLYRTPSG